MRFRGWIAVALCLAASLSADTLLTMKSGQRYELVQPPKHKNGMASFTTQDKRFLTVKESEIASEEPIVRQPPKVKLDRRDDKQLGAIAREQRAERGIDADVSGDHPQSGETKKPEKKAEKKPAHRPHKKAPPPPPPPASEEHDPSGR